MNLFEAAGGPPFDVVVIGGGINGCAIARETARRGLRTALFEADDFGFGTTWRSTKLIHGGLRYLEHGDVRLVFESLRERRWLLRTRRHLVQPQRFVLPILPWTRRPAWQLRVGLAAYDALAGRGGVPGHRVLSDSDLHELKPELPRETRGGFSFYDARVRAPERLALELALEAEAAGAVIANHAPVTHIATTRGKVSGVTVHHAGEDVAFAARVVVNAAGPWVDAVRALTGDGGADLLGVTRGSHIVVETGEKPGGDAIFSTAREDGRVLFAVPQDRLILIGTTDLRFDGEPGTIRPTGEEVEYLLREAQALMPGLGLRKDQVRYAYAGLRPLQRVKGGPEAAISRRHAVIDHGRGGGAGGLLSIVGGKLSTFRPLAREVADRAASPVGADSQPRGSESEPGTAPGEANADGDGPGWREAILSLPATTEQKRHLRIYGTKALDVLALGDGSLCEHAGAVEGEVTWVARREHGATLSDILMRRTGIAWAACRGMCCVQRAADLAAGALSWGDERRAQEVEAFVREAAYHLPTPAMLEDDDDAGP